MSMRCQYCGTIKGSPHRMSCRTRSNPSAYRADAVYVSDTSSTWSPSDTGSGSGSSSGSSCDSGSSGSSDSGGGGGCE